MTPTREQIRRPIIQEGDIVVYADGFVQRPDAVWRRAMNGVDRDAYEIVAIYRHPLWEDAR